jgi:hypothetical protein
MRRWGLLLPVAAVLAANLFVLGGVAMNRAGQPEARVELTERELHLVPLGDENTGLAMRLIVTRPGFPHKQGWLNRAKLAELGLDPPDPSAQAHHPGVLSKEAFVAIDCQANQPQSRLVAVDVARDADVLRQRYPDRQRFIVTRGWLGPRWRDGRRTGVVLDLLVSDIHVPLPYSRILSGLAMTPNQGDFEPRYKVALCYGKNYQPWICDCRLVRGGPAGGH